MYRNINVLKEMLLSKINSINESKTWSYTCSGLNLLSSSIDGKVLDNENKYIKVIIKIDKDIIKVWKKILAK